MRYVVKITKYFMSEYFACFYTERRIKIVDLRGKREMKINQKISFYDCVKCTKLNVVDEQLSNAKKFL